MGREIVAQFDYDPPFGRFLFLDLSLCFGFIFAWGCGIPRLLSYLFALGGMFNTIGHERLYIL